MRHSASLSTLFFYSQTTCLVSSICTLIPAAAAVAAADSVISIGDCSCVKYCVYQALERGEEAPLERIPLGGSHTSDSNKGRNIYGFWSQERRFLRSFALWTQIFVAWISSLLQRVVCRLADTLTSLWTSSSPRTRSPACPSLILLLSRRQGSHRSSLYTHMTWYVQKGSHCHRWLNTHDGSHSYQQLLRILNLSRYRLSNECPSSLQKNVFGWIKEVD